MIPIHAPNSNTQVNSPESVWTQERIERLQALWLEGKSFSDIADVLGSTRNAVIGKAHRLGLCRPKDKTRVSIARPAPAQPVTPMPRPADLPKRRGKPVKLTELQHWMCRFPLGDPKSPDFRFCAEPTIDDKSSWCADCARQVFVVMPARMRRRAA